MSIPNALSFPNAFAIPNTISIPRLELEAVRCNLNAILTFKLLKRLLVSSSDDDHVFTMKRRSRQPAPSRDPQSPDPSSPPITNLVSGPVRHEMCTSRASALDIGNRESIGISRIVRSRTSSIGPIRLDPITMDHTGRHETIRAWSSRYVHGRDMGSGHFIAHILNVVFPDISGVHKGTGPLATNHSTLTPINSPSIVDAYWMA